MNDLPLRPAGTSDIDHIVALERTSHARAFVGQWSEERHRTTLAGSDARYFVVESGQGDLAAYIILRGFAEDTRAIELKRIVVASPGSGLGRHILIELMRLVFIELRAHRFFLDVYEDNARARRLYESLGFRYEGTLREAALRDGEWHNLCVMSILEDEYRQRNRAI